MDLSLLPKLEAYIRRLRGASGGSPEELAHSENFAWDERPPLQGVKLYGSYLNGDPDISDLDAWNSLHRNYLEDNIRIGSDEEGQPWTFRLENDLNRLHSIDKRINLLRVEEASWPCELAGVTVEELRAQLDLYWRGNTGAKDWLNHFCAVWNEARDKRPLFATTEIEVNDLLAEEDWPEQLRNRLGLGHCSPRPGGPPVEILIMGYSVAEVLAAHHGIGFPAVPTVLDSDLSCYFYPSPIPASTCHDAPYYGHTVNLSPVLDEDDYEMGIELLHPRIDYLPEHFHRIGVISKPVTMPLEQARRFHLPWLRAASMRDNFGEDYSS